MKHWGKMMGKLSKTGLKIAAMINGLLIFGGGLAGFVEWRNNKDSRHEQNGIYETYFKRPMDFVCGGLALIVFWPLYLGVAILVHIKLGSPVIFTQERPGKNEKLFKLYKFRTMTDERDENGELLPDEIRLTKFGKLLRATSLDELPEALNIIKGDMSVIGPRPQLVRDMVFMTEKQRRRHTVRPGLSGLAQINGRNDISWEDKLNWDLKYIERISFIEDIKIIIRTAVKALITQDGITEGEMATAEDYGDYLLAKKKITKKEYDKKQAEAKELIEGGK